VVGGGGGGGGEDGGGGGEDGEDGGDGGVLGEGGDGGYGRVFYGVGNVEDEGRDEGVGCAGEEELVVVGGEDTSRWLSKGDVVNGWWRWKWWCRRNRC